MYGRSFPVATAISCMHVVQTARPASGHDIQEPARQIELPLVLMTTVLGISALDSRHAGMLTMHMHGINIRAGINMQPARQPGACLASGIDDHIHADVVCMAPQQRLVAAQCGERNALVPLCGIEACSPNPSIAHVGEVDIVRHFHGKRPVWLHTHAWSENSNGSSLNVACYCNAD